MLSEIPAPLFDCHQELLLDIRANMLCGGRSAENKEVSAEASEGSEPEPSTSVNHMISTRRQKRSPEEIAHVFCQDSKIKELGKEMDMTIHLPSGEKERLERLLFFF